MNSLILCTATRFLLPLLLLFSFFLLIRGHNEPGGGFIAGLVAASAYALYGIAYGVEAARRALRIHPRTLIGIGLLTAVSSGLVSVLRGQPLMTGQWGRVSVPGLGEIAIGTPLMFDMGVYLAVIGVTLIIILTLGEE